MESSASPPEEHSFAATNAEVGLSRYASDYIPSGFPKRSDYSAQKLSIPKSANSTMAHADANSSSTSAAAAPHGYGSGVPSPLLHTDSAAAAEWRALYGSNAAMMAANAGAFRSGSAGVSFMTPIFHLTAHDATILSMEHNNHCKLLGIATSKNEILVTWTQLMPVIENMGALRTAEDDLFGREEGPPIDERLLEWDPATMSILIDELPYACTELSWAPWQQGIYLTGLCPGHGIHIYRYSHGHWARDGCIRTMESTSYSISKHFTVACACSRGRVELWARGAAATAGHVGPATSSSVGGHAPSNFSNRGGTAGAANGGSAWVLCCTLTLPIVEDEDAQGGGGNDGSRRHENGHRNAGSSSVGGITSPPTAPTGGHHRLRDIVSVGWDESGALLAVGDQGGTVHIVSVTQDSTRLGDVVFHLPQSDNSGSCRQVAWAPSSGRSFLPLAIVFANSVQIVLFRRPRFMSAAGLPHPGHGGRAGSAALNPSVTDNNNNINGSMPGAALQVLASALVPCEEAAKLSWNGTGTRFVTSHLDSSVNIWAMDVRYQYQSRQDGNACSRLAGGEGSAPNAGENGGVGNSTPSEMRLNLVVSVRRTSSVHPYHAVSS